MGLDPQCDLVLKGLASMGLAPVETTTIDEGRATVASFALMMGQPEDVAAVVDVEFAGPGGTIPARVYTPSGTGPLPVVLYFHGGGFATGDVAMCDTVTRALANRSGAVVVSVDYRLGPEDPFPAAVDDAYAAVVWAAGAAREMGADPARLGVCGDSAGGTLSAVACLMARDRGGPGIAFQALVYPATDAAFDMPSHRENGEGYLLTAGLIKWFWDHYGDPDPADWRVSPLRAADHSGLPPAFIATCEFDPLRDEGEAYGARLAEAGVAAEVKRYDGLIHGAFWLGGVVEAGARMVDDVGAALRAGLAGQPGDSPRA